MSRRKDRISKLKVLDSNADRETFPPASSREYGRTLLPVPRVANAATEVSSTEFSKHICNFYTVLFPCSAQKKKVVGDASKIVAKGAPSTHFKIPCNR